jgi:hypothetical protein
MYIFANFPYVLRKLTASYCQLTHFEYVTMIEYQPVQLHTTENAEITAYWDLSREFSWTQSLDSTIIPPKDLQTNYPRMRYLDKNLYYKTLAKNIHTPINQYGDGLGWKVDFYLESIRHGKIPHWFPSQITYSLYIQILRNLNSIVFYSEYFYKQLSLDIFVWICRFGFADQAILVLNHVEKSNRIWFDKYLYCGLAGAALNGHSELVDVLLKKILDGQIPISTVALQKSVNAASQRKHIGIELKLKHLKRKIQMNNWFPRIQQKDFRRFQLKKFKSKEL